MHFVWRTAGRMNSFLDLAQYKFFYKLTGTPLNKDNKVTATFIVLGVYQLHGINLAAFLLRLRGKHPFMSLFSAFL